MENTQINTQPKKRPDRHGSNNPMWGRHHSAITRQKQSDAAVRRNQQYKKALDAQHHLTMDEFLSNNPVAEHYIRKMIKEEIDRFVWKETKRALPRNIWL